MRKIYSLVLMTAMLFIGANAWGADKTVSAGTFQALNDSIVATGGTGKVTLLADINENVTTSGWVGTWIGAANYDATAQAIELDLNGHQINITANSNDITVYPFVITKGELKVVNNAATLSTITLNVKKTTKGEGSNIFWVFGSYDYTINPKGNNPFSHLEIGNNVKVTTNNGTVIAVDAKKTATAKETNYHTMYFTDRGMAFGARVDVKGTLISQGGSKCYGIKTNGILGYPNDTVRAKSKINTADWITTDYKDGIKTAAAIANVAYVHVHQGAVINSDPTIQKSAAVYCSGYAQWLIEGTCDGNIGVSVSSGDIDINDATITSSASTHVAPNGGNSVSGAGSAIVVNSRDAYAGAVDVNISGDTEVSSQSGYAIEEVVNTTTNPQTGEQETKVQDIQISGGTFQGGTDPNTHEQQPAVIISSTTAGEADVVVYGGNVEGELVVDGDNTKSLDDFVPETAHTTTVVVNGKDVTVISDGAAPTGQTTVAGHDGESVKWTGTSETISTDLTLTELEINESTAQTLTIAQGKKLTVGRVVLGANAQVIVEAGATLIIDGAQGFVAPVASNLVLKANNNSQATFLFNPAVTSNRQPNATVQIYTYAKQNSASSYTWQRMVSPMATIANITHNGASAPLCPASTFNTFRWWTEVWDYEQSSWVNTTNNDDLGAFRCFQLTNNSANGGITYTFTGNLQGTVTNTINFNGVGYNYFGNSYTAPMSLSEIASTVYGMVGEGNIDGSIWLWNKAGRYEAANSFIISQGAYVGSPEIPAFHSFILKQTGANTLMDLNYTNTVWNYNMGITSAPTRVNSNINAVRINVVSSEGDEDYVFLAEDADLTADYDNGVDAVKMTANGRINFYVMSENDNLQICGSDNIVGTLLSLETQNEINYTLSFSNVRGEVYALRDNMTNAVVLMNEGATYNFTAQPNATLNGRFQIVSRQEMPTAVETIEETVAPKAIYTIMGQYVGETTDWNNLPAGVYVVDGVKVIK